MAKSIEFTWNPEEISIYMRAKEKAVEYQDSVRVANKVKKELGRDPKILEAGSGNGCVVLMFDKMGFKNICGIEYNKEIISVLNKEFPDINFVNGDILNMPDALQHNDFIMSFGLMEHFIDGPDIPLKAMYNALNDGGYAVISVPCLNFARRVKRYFDRGAKRAIKKVKKSGIKFKYYPWFLNGAFYEYHMTPRQFRRECENAGFKIIKHAAAQQNLGIMHVLNPHNKPGKLIWYYELEEYNYSKMGRLVYWIANKLPFLFNHFQYCILYKEPKKS